jgi:hypothetical protein
VQSKGNHFIGYFLPCFNTYGLKAFNGYLYSGFFLKDHFILRSDTKNPPENNVFSLGKVEVVKSFMFGQGGVSIPCA